MNNHIKWKTIAIEIVFERVLLKGQVRYWAKDYEVDLIEPFKAQQGSHLMYSVPVRFVSDEQPKDGIEDINVVAVARELLVKLYKDNHTEGKL